MINPDWNLQVKIGHGRSDTGAYHRAIEVARIYNAYDLHRQLQQSGCGAYNIDHNVTVYPAVYELEAGRDYEIVPMSGSHQLDDLYIFYPLAESSL